MTQNVKYRNPSRPIVLQHGITSEDIWDSILFVGGGTVAESKWNPTKLTVIEYPERENVMIMKQWLENEVEHEEYSGALAAKGYESLESLRGIEDQQELGEMGIPEEEQGPMMAEIEKLRDIEIFDKLIKKLKAQKQWVRDGEFRNLLQMVHALHYGFGFSVPFPMGPGSLPSPIHYCQHYGEWMREMILTRDDTEGKLQIEMSKRPKIVFHNMPNDEGDRE